MRIPLIDAHCHLEGIPDKELNGLVSHALEAGVNRMITSPTQMKEWARSREISQRYREVEYTLGLHPWFLQEKDRNVKTLLRENYSEDVIGIGEIGLDGGRKKIDIKLQIAVFTEQLEFAIEKNLPVIIHCHRAWSEMIKVLKETGVPRAGGFVHSANTSPEIAESLFTLGLSISAGGNTAFNPGRKLVQSLKAAYPNHLLIETDSPNMNPLKRSEPNRPENISVNLKNIASLLGEPETEVARATTENASKIFRLELG